MPFAAVGAIAIAATTGAVARPAAAAEVVSPSQSIGLQAHGFVSQGFIKTTANNYFADTERGSFEFTEVGLNFTAQLTSELRIGLQLFSRDLGPVGNYSIKADWFYLDYRFADWLGLRAGRVKLPFGLYNDTSDIDAARVAVLLPQSVYPLGSRDFLLAQTGMELYGYLPGALGALDYRLYGGTIFVEIPTAPGAPFQVQTLGIPYVLGGRLLWETPLDGLRVGGSVQALRLETALLFAPPTGTVTADVDALLWLASVEYAAQDLLLAAEYGRWHVDTSSSDATAVPAGSSSSERGYALGAYRVLPWLTPGAYYSLFFPDVANRDAGPAAVQHDLAATLRFDINPNWLVKLEGHYMHGTAGLVPALNGNVPAAMLEDDWGVFLVKTTAYF